MKHIILILLFLSNNAFCQFKKDEQVYNNAFYYELLGHTRSLVSFNYEMSFYRINNFLCLNARTGIGFETTINSEGIKSDRLITIPNVVLLQVGGKTHFANLGIGYSVTFSKHLIDNSNYPRFDSAYSLSLGYKLVYNNVFIQFYPVRIVPKNFEAENSVGLSFGLAF